MSLFIKKIKEVRQHFLDGDDDLGFRRLTDCVLDTQDKTCYRKLIALCEQRDEMQLADFVQACLDLLSELEAVECQEMKNPAVLLKVQELTKKYARGRFKLGAISMEIQSGEVWGLVGENGNGKTTLLRILAKELTFDSGNIDYTISDKNVTDYDLRTRLVYIPQRTKKWYGPVKDNLKLAASHYGVKGEENELLVLMYIIRFGLWKYRDFYWGQLSSGYKMRFELARTFLRSPQLLLLDEPLANLDVLSQQLILDDLKHLAQSISHPIGIILSSQQLYEVEKVSDRVLFLKNGAPTHLSTANEPDKQEQTILEMDLSCSKEQLLVYLKDFALQEITFNGGIFLVTINQPEVINSVLQVLMNNQVKIKYLRDISQSSRRFFK